jgi:hypothetical protein
LVLQEVWGGGRSTRLIRHNILQRLDEIHTHKSWRSWSICNLRLINATTAGSMLLAASVEIASTSSTELPSADRGWAGHEGADGCAGGTMGAIFRKGLEAAMAAASWKVVPPSEYVNDITCATSSSESRRGMGASDEEHVAMKVGDEGVPAVNVSSTIVRTKSES